MNHCLILCAKLKLENAIRKFFFHEHATSYKNHSAFHFFKNVLKFKTWMQCLIRNLKKGYNTNKRIKYEIIYPKMSIPNNVIKILELFKTKPCAKTSVFIKNWTTNVYIRH